MPKVKLALVMIIIPVILNAINFWIIDNILKFKPESSPDGNMVAITYEKEEEKRDKSRTIKPESNAINEVIIVENLEVANGD